MDAYGHVNNVQFLRLFEDARVTTFKDWFGPANTLLDEGILVTRHEIEYLAPLSFRHEPVRVDVWVSDVVGAGFTLAYEMRDPDPLGQTRYAVATTGLVAYDFATARPRRLPAPVRSVLAEYADEPPGWRWRR